MFLALCVLPADGNGHFASRGHRHGAPIAALSDLVHRAGAKPSCSLGPLIRSRSTYRSEESALLLITLE
jgi:hypothetical protein